jgi:hypothetical protein
VFHENGSKGTIRIIFCSTYIFINYLKFYDFISSLAGGKMGNSEDRVAEEIRESEAIKEESTIMTMEWDAIRIVT